MNYYFCFSLFIIYTLNSKMLLLYSTTRKLDKTIFSIHIGIIFIFAILYYIAKKIEIHYNMKHFETQEPVTISKTYRYYHPFMSSLYFSLVTHTTVGYGYQKLPTFISQTVNILHLFTIVFLVCFV